MTNNNFYKDKTILVTGGAGSIGSNIVKRLLSYHPRVVRIFDNNETGLFNLDQALLGENIRPFIGDVRDKDRLNRAMEDVDVVFHAAALKHVPLCEYNPFEAVRTNVIGTQNVISTASNNRVGKVINISTDKAVNPINVMGATKLLSERLITTAGYYKGKKRTIFSSVRFGNVLPSRGSVTPLLHRQIKSGGPVTVTDPEMKRFVMKISEAVDLVLRVGRESKGGEIFILKMPVLRIGDLVEVMIEELAPKYNYQPEEIEVKIVGERKGEKFSEELIAKEEMSDVAETKEMFIIRSNKGKRYINKNKKVVSETSPLKNPPLLTKEEIKKILDKII